MRKSLIIFLIVILITPELSLATISFGTAGTVATGTTSLSVPYPSGISAGDIIVLQVASVYSATASTPGGFIAPTNYHNVANLSSIDTFYRVADGSETGNLSVTISGATSAIGRMWRYTCSTNCTWSVAAALGDDANGGEWSATAGSDPGVTAGDWVVMGSSWNDSSGASAEAITQTGVTYGTATERNDSNFDGGVGDNVTLVVSDHVADSGTSSAAPVYTFTITPNTFGPSVFLRIREVPGSVTPVVKVRLRIGVRIRVGVKFR